MKIKNFTVIGNCQARSLTEFLLSNNDFKNEYKYIQINDIFRMNEEELDELYLNILPILDLIIIQPISENYRNNYKYSTKSILNTVNITCKKILFPSLYFDFYHPFISYIYDNNKSSWKLGNPFDYHDKNIVNLYINNYDNILTKYKKILLDDNLLEDDFFNNRLKKILIIC